MIKSLYICPVCKKNHLLDKNNSGDWYNTEWGTILQSFCPECGRMSPLVSGESLSRRKLKALAIKIATKFNLSFEICRRIAMKSDGVNYVEDFSSELDITPEEVKQCL